jgi:hypothetical protein
VAVCLSTKVATLPFLLLSCGEAWNLVEFNMVPVVLPGRFLVGDVRVRAGADLPRALLGLNPFGSVVVLTVLFGTNGSVAMLLKRVVACG